MPDHNFLRALGLTVVEVPDLPAKATLVRDQRVFLVRKGLDPGDRGWVAAWMLEQAGALLELTPPPSLH